MAKIGIGSLYKNQIERVAVMICQEFSVILHNLKAEELISNIVGTSNVQKHVIERSHQHFDSASYISSCLFSSIQVE